MLELNEREIKLVNGGCSCVCRSNANGQTLYMGTTQDMHRCNMACSKSNASVISCN